MTTIAGYLRKRPGWGKGHWRTRYFVLENGVIEAYSSEAAANKKDKSDVGPTHRIQLYKDVLVSEPFQKHVRVNQISNKKESVWVIQIFRDGASGVEVLVTLGGPSREDAAKWKISVEQAAKSAPSYTASDGTVTGMAKRRSTAGKGGGTGDGGAGYKGPELWSEDENWQIIEAQDGLQIEGEKEFVREFPTLRARATVQASPDEVFKLIMDDSRRTLWDDSVQENKVLRHVSPTCDIVYVQMRAIWVGPLYTSPRDLVLLRYWRKEDDGDSYVVTWQSVEDPELSPVREGFVRGKIFAMGFTINKSGNNGSLVRISCHADPGPPLSLLPSAVLQRWMLPFVTRLLGLKKALANPNSKVNIDHEQDTAELSMASTSSASTAHPKLALAAAATPSNESQRRLTINAEKNTLKLGSLDHSTWGETPPEEPYTIRGKNYLEDGIKYKNGTAMFHVAAADLYKLKAPTPHCAARSDSPLAEITKQYPDRQIFVLQFMLPGPPFYSLAMYAVSKKGALDDADSPFAKLFNDFRDGSDEYRNSVFKLIPRVTQGAYIVRKTVGETPALLGKKMKMVYYVGPNYVECDCDLGTSSVAGSILSIVKGYATTLTVDLGVLLEGHSSDELPEEILMGFRLIKPVLAKAPLQGPDPNPEASQRNQTLLDRKNTVAKEDFLKGGGIDDDDE